MPPEARRLTRLVVGWSLLVDALPVYPLYALFFADTGLSDRQISLLFAAWSASAIVAEVPSGALADRFSRRGALVAGCVMQGTAFGVWLAAPTFAGFVAGFVVWGFGGALTSGSFEALIYDGLAAVGAPQEYAKVRGWTAAAGYVVQLPSAVAATALFAVGGFPLAGWASIGASLAAALLALRLPESSRGAAGAGALDDAYEAGVHAEDHALGYLETLRAGLRSATLRPGVRRLVLAAGVIAGLVDTFDEYIPLVLSDWGMPTTLVPSAMVVVWLSAAAAAACAGIARGVGARALAVALLVVSAVVAAVTQLRQPVVGLLAVSLFYAVLRLVVVLLGALLQDQLDSASRATATSVVAVVTELFAFVVYAAWAFGQVLAIAAIVAVAAVALPCLLGEEPHGSAGGAYAPGTHRHRPARNR